MPRPKSPDPKRNAGISLTAAEMAKLDDYAKEAKISRSEVVSLLIGKLPDLWMEWLRQN